MHLLFINLIIIGTPSCAAELEQVKFPLAHEVLCEVQRQLKPKKSAGRIVNIFIPGSPAGMHTLFCFNESMIFDQIRIL